MSGKTDMAKAPEIGEVRGPWRTSPGNTFPWMAYCRGANGWIPCHGKTAAEAMTAAREFAAKHADALLARIPA